ncbi:uncharacterized protein isoform X2 [Leptinotarsa decemlineata]|uniref:uncharacterized protein isoform X2 n=1 Tax=Leptinotarsa decemlineata TaxID=7539 RepID=UPI003D305884
MWSFFYGFVIEQLCCFFLHCMISTIFYSKGVVFCLRRKGLTCIQNFFFEMGEYAVIRFSVDESFSEIPLSWICPGRKECWWPKTKNVANLMARNLPPDKENWEKHSIEMIAFSSSLESARKKAVDSEYYTTSDESSNKGRGKRLKRPKNFSSSSDEENEAHTPPPALKKIPSIETYPLIHRKSVHTPPPVPKIIPSRENYSSSKQTSDSRISIASQSKLRRNAGQDNTHHSDHESSNSEHFISSDTTHTQEINSGEENEDITLISKENISQTEEISRMSENIKGN